MIVSIGTITQSDAFGDSHPTTSPQFYAINEDTVLVIPPPGILSGTTDPENQTLEIILDSYTQNGIVVVEQDGSFTYTPDLNFNGVDSFTFHVEDPDMNMSHPPETVTIHVNPVNDPPVAEDDYVTIDEDMTISISVLDNDLDVDGDSLTITSYSEPKHGTTFLEGKTIIYTPEDGFSGTDSFIYVISDISFENILETSTPDFATVTIMVNSLNDPPIANDDVGITDEDTILNVVADYGVLSNDTDPDDDDLRVSSFDSISKEGATVTVNIDGSYLYDPTTSLSLNALPTGEIIDDTFSYEISDENEETSTAIVTITITGVNDAPEFSSEFVTSVLVDNQYNYDISAIDPDGDNLSITISVIPEWLEFQDFGDGTANLNGIPGAKDTDNVNIVLTVSDSQASTILHN